VKELNERSKTLSWEEKVVGMAPVKLLRWRKRNCREGREGISEGRFPLRRLERRLRTLRASNFPRVLAGIGPTSPTPGSRREATRVPSEVHLMPTQDVQIEVAGFQLKFRL